MTARSLEGFAFQVSVPDLVTTRSPERGFLFEWQYQILCWRVRSILL